MPPLAMSDVLRSHSAIVAGRVLRQGLVWWLAELRDMVPRRLVAFLGGNTGNGTVLQIGGDQATLLMRGSRRADAATLPIVRDQLLQSKARTQAMLRSRQAGNRVLIQLAPDAVLEMDIVLPLAAEPTLSQVLRHQLERLTPLAIDTVSFAFRVTARMPADKTLRVALIVVKKITLESAIRLARELGLRPTSVIGPAPAQDAPLTLWRAAAGIASPRHRSWRRGLDVLVLAALLGTYVVHVARLDRQRETLGAEVDRAKQEAAGVQALAQGIETQQKLLVALAARQSAISPLRALDALTRAVPLDSWVFQFGMSGGVVDISGYAPRATDLIARIETSPLFEMPKFRTPITLAPDGKAEQFSLTFAVHEKPRP
jgi:general secretion pathway protein L